MLPFAYLYKKKHNNVWLFFARDDDLESNAYTLYNWIGPKKDFYFILDRHSPQFQEGMLPCNSLKHMFLSAAARVDVFDFTRGDCFNPKLKRLLKMKTTRVFLQHGMTRVDIPTFHYEHAGFDLVLATNRRELQFLHEAFHYPPSHLALTGLARHDDLIQNASDKRFIFIMPTWRRELLHMHPEEFVKTEFYLKFQSLLCNPTFAEFLARNHVQLRFFLHFMIGNKQNLFCYPEGVSVYSETDCVHDLLRDCSMLITDYSSVQFDAALTGKPVVYYQFLPDTYNGENNYFQYDRDGFGPITHTEEELIKAVIGCWNGSAFVQPPEYVQRQDFFEFHDTNHCQRIWDAIQKKINS